MNSKSKLGQFYTTNSDYILQGISIPSGSKVIEPFVGDGDLVRWCETQGCNSECYDIDPPKSSYAKSIVIQDTLMFPPNYDDKFIVTNPPYLALNKAEKLSEENPFTKWGVSDLYKAFVSSFCEQRPAGGVMIVPLNFLCDAKGTESRKEFLSKFHIERVNIFEDAVFEDTSYTVCAIRFSSSDKAITSADIPGVIYPGGKEVSIKLSEKYDWQIAGEVFCKDIHSQYKISRLVNANDTPLKKDARDKCLKPKSLNKITNLLLHCVDGKGRDRGAKVRLEWNEVPLFGKDTDRSFCTLVIEPPLSREEQRKLIVNFNDRLDRLRRDYHSLFMTNFREFGRKRISFSTAFKIIKMCLEKEKG